MRWSTSSSSSSPRPPDPKHGRYGYLNLALGKLSYSQVPIQYGSIFGVTGSLGVLPAKQLEILRQTYGVHKFSYFPSFWGEVT